MHEPDPIQSPHDALFHAALSDPECAADLLRSVLPKDLVSAIDWRSLRRIEASFVDEELRNSKADLLFVADLEGRETFLYLLLEHKSGEDPFCAFQMMRYVTRIWEQFLREYAQASHLPPVVPFVLHHGTSAWRSPRNVRELIDLDGLPRSLIDLQPQFGFALDDLGACDEDDLIARKLLVQPLLPLLHLQQVRQRASTAALLAEWKHFYRRLLARPGCQDLVGQLVSYVTTVSNDDHKDLRAAYGGISKPTEEQFMTAAEQLIQEGRTQGIEQGIDQGLRTGQANALLTLLQQRFGELPPEFTQEIRSASIEDLERWMQRVLAAETPGDVVAE